MFNFDLKKAAIFQAIELEPVFKFVGFLKKASSLFFVFAFLLFWFGFLFHFFTERTNQILLGLSCIFLTVSIGSWLKQKFFCLKLQKPRLKINLEDAVKRPGEFNLAEFLSFESAKAVAKSIKISQRRKIPENNSTVLFYCLISDNPKLNFVFHRALLNIDEIKQTLKNYFKILSSRPSQKTRKKGFSRTLTYSKAFQDSLLKSLEIAHKKGHQRIEIGDILTGLAQHDLIFKKILIDFKLKNKDIENLTCWLESLEQRIEERKKFWEWKNLIKTGFLAKEWAFGHTVTLDKFSIDLSKIIRRQGFPEIIGHQKETEAIERILARREINNVLLIGEPGIGKKSIIQRLTKKSFLGDSLPETNYKRVVALNIPAVLAQSRNQREAEAILDKIFQEVVFSGNVILVINDFYNFVRTEIQPGIIDIFGILSYYLSLSQFQIVAITTYSGFYKYLEQKPGLLNLFEKVEVSELSETETLTLLEELSLVHEQKQKIFISFPALKEIISLADRYLPDTPFPKKAISVLDEVVVYVSSTKDKLVLPKHVAKIITEKTQIPVGEIEEKEKEILLNLEKLVHQRIINQEQAVKEVSTALRRARAEITARKGPMGCFLFLGPTGVGKTELAKALAEIYFGSEDRMIRLDMSEFQMVEDISRLIGSPSEKGLLTSQIRETPFSLILLDEIEKAHPNILNLFLQVLDEGHLTDGLGRKIDFKSAIIVATSNAGYQVILEALKQKDEWSSVKQKLLDYLFEKAIFRPEFINRFDAMVVFSSLNKENLLEVAELMFQKLKKNLKEKDIEFIITLALKQKIVDLGYSPTFGAREMKRVIQDKVENALALALLSGELKRGDKVEIDPVKFNLKITSS